MPKVGDKYYQVVHDDTGADLQTWVIRTIKRRPKTKPHHKFIEAPLIIYLVEKCSSTYGIISKKKVNGKHGKYMKTGWYKSIPSNCRKAIPYDNFVKGERDGLRSTKAQAYRDTIKRCKSSVDWYDKHKDDEEYKGDEEYLEEWNGYKKTLTSMKAQLTRCKK